MSLLTRLFGFRRETNLVTHFERRRFTKSMAGEAATTAAARLGCIAG